MAVSSVGGSPVTRMKAVVQDRYGSAEALQLREVDRPSPAQGRVLIRVRAASVNALDHHLMSGQPALARLMFGMRRPKRPIRGVDVAGTIESVGPGVTRWAPGDPVFGTGNETFAEFCTAPEGTVAAKPANLSYAQAAAVPIAAFTALEAARDHARIQPGQRVLVNGAGGGVGTFAVQLAKWLGGTILATTTNDRVAMVSGLGAERVFDYTREDVFRSEERFDAILDLGAGRPLRQCRRLLKPTGRYVQIGSTEASTWWYLARSLTLSLSNLTNKKKAAGFIAKGSDQDLLVLKELLEAGKLRPVIDREYPLDQVPDAIRRVLSGQASGKVVVRVASD